MNESTIKERFDRLDLERSNILKRARKCSEVTIPALMPPDSHSENNSLKTPFQALGARVVNNLASKLLLTLMPPNTPFFRFVIEDATFEAMLNDAKVKGATEIDNFKTKVEEKFSMLEKRVQKYIEENQFRTPVYRALKLLVTTGNALCYLPDTDSMRVYKLDQYVCRRDTFGNVIEIITHDKIAKDALGDELKQLVEQELSSETQDASVHKVENELDLYTRVVLNTEGKYDVSQEICGKDIPSSTGIFKKQDLPFLALRWTYVDGEDYGRGHVEEYLGDFISLEGLMENIITMSAIGSQVKYLVKPGCPTNINDLNRAPNGSFVRGNPEDIKCLQLDKINDYKISLETVQTFISNLSQAFLLNSSVQRNAERVTAEEIKYVASELESALGGIYGILTQEFQQPLLRLIINKMKRLKKLPALPNDSVKFVITTGLEALGRGQDLNKLMSFMQTLGTFGPNVLTQYINMPDFISRVGASIGIDMMGLVKTKEQMQQEQQQAMIQQAAMQYGPGMMKDVVNKGLEAQASKQEAVEQ